MHHRPLRLFGKADGVASSLGNALSLLLSSLMVVIATAPTRAMAQASAVSVPQTNQESKTSIASVSRKSSGGALGVYLGDVNEERAKELKVSEARGAVVGKVEEGSPAAKAGLQENDVILAFKDQQIYNPTQLYRLLTESAPGSNVMLGISRNGTSLTVVVTLGQRQASPWDEQHRLYATADAYLATAEERARQAEEARQRGDEKEAARLVAEEKEFRRAADESRASIEKDLREANISSSTVPKRISTSAMAARYQLGVRVMPLTDQLAKFFNARGGVLVSEVRVGGVAESAGIKAGDCIVAVNGERVGSLADLNRLVDRTDKNDKDSGEVTMSIVRDRAEQTVKVKFGQR